MIRLVLIATAFFAVISIGDAFKDQDFKVRKIPRKLASFDHAWLPRSIAVESLHATKLVCSGVLYMLNPN